MYIYIYIYLYINAYLLYISVCELERLERIFQAFPIIRVLDTITKSFFDMRETLYVEREW